MLTATLSGNPDAIPTADLPTPQTPDGRLVRDFIEWMSVQEKGLTDWYNQIVLAALKGFARCDQVQAYNREAIRFYTITSSFLNDLDAAFAALGGDARRFGIPKEPPTPALLSHGAVRVEFLPDGSRTISSPELACLPNGLLNVQGLRFIARGTCPSCPTIVGQDVKTTPGGELRFAQIIGACAAAPFACALAGGLVIGVVVLGGRAAVNIFDSIGGQFSGASKEKYKLAIVEAVARMEAFRLAAYNNCVDLRLAKLPGGGTPEQQQQISNDCFKHVQALKTDDLLRDLKPGGTPGLLEDILKIVLIGGALAGAGAIGLVIYKRQQNKGAMVRGRRSAHA
jgi:hypothetical protein